MRDLVLKGENLSDRARKNLSILDAIRRSGPISKTEISSFIGVNVVTVSNYVEEFLRQKLIFEKELDISKGGRRPVLLDLNTDSGYAIGVGLNLLSNIAVLIDMKGKLILKIKRDRPQDNAADIVESILKLIKDLLLQATDYKDKIKGIGVAIAGIVDNNRETVRWPERIDKDNDTYSLITLPLKDIIEKEFNYPVRVDNDATMACFGEQWLSREVEVKNILYMLSGVGCGIMINGEIYRGVSGCAGEISIYNPKEQQGQQEQQEFYCTVGQPCLLKRWEVDIGILNLAKKEAPSNKSSKIWELCGGSVENLNLKNIFEAVHLEDLLALDIVKKAARRLGMKIAFLVNLLNPQTVIIGGGLEEAGMPFIDEIRRTVSEWSFEEASSAVKIIPSRLGENAVALGAANFIVREVFADTKE
ncbi:MAG: ROK family transcriptional regulator [Candidatus Omnitrophica bacterium]|nr:ROK family transcriptional regulator [Candidatus Omnitrophota bacterium]